MASSKPKTATQPKPEETSTPSETQEPAAKPPIKLLFQAYTQALQLQEQAEKAVKAAAQAKSDAVGEILKHYGKREFGFRGDKITPVMKTIKGKNGAADKVVYFFKSAKEEETITVE